MQANGLEQYLQQSLTGQGDNISITLPVMGWLRDPLGSGIVMTNIAKIEVVA
jgi:hypothetical protein